MTYLGAPKAYLFVLQLYSHAVEAYVKISRITDLINRTLFSILSSHCQPMSKNSLLCVAILLLCVTSTFRLNINPLWMITPRYLTSFIQGTCRHFTYRSCLVLVSGSDAPKRRPRRLADGWLWQQQIRIALIVIGRVRQDRIVMSRNVYFVDGIQWRQDGSFTNSLKTVTEELPLSFDLLRRYRSYFGSYFYLDIKWNYIIVKV